MSRGLMPFLVIATRQSTSWSGNSLEAARIVGRRRDHVQRLHAEHGDEGLHRVVREHAAAAALAGTGVQRHARPPRRIGIARDLERGDQVDALAGLGIDARLDRAVGEEDRRLVVLEHRRQRADRRLVARDDGDQALHLVRVQVDVDASLASSRPISENRMRSVPFSWPSDTPSV